MLRLTDHFENTLKNETGRTRRRRFIRVILAMLLLAIAVLLGERFRGKWELKRWKEQAVAKGDKLDVVGLWPATDSRSASFSKQLAGATEDQAGKLGKFAGSVAVFIANEHGEFRRGSQEARPLVGYLRTSTNTWQEVDAALKQNEAALTSLRELMKNPPSTMSRDVVKKWAINSQPNFVSVRRGAQLLQTAAMNDLHNNDLSHALENLLALEGVVRLYENDPGLINYMIRITILGLGIEAGWDALQADGWTQSQLATLQQSCADPDKLLSQMPRTLEAERVRRIYELRWFRSHSYTAWIDRYQEIYQSFGCKLLPCDTAPVVRCWRQCVFHPLWNFAWADQEESNYLKATQLDVNALHDAVQNRAWSSLQNRLIANQKAYHTPAANWRFYTRLPVSDDLVDAMSPTNQPARAYPYPDFIKAWYSAMSILTQHEILLTAIALKRFELQHGNNPSNLTALVPEFLPALPTDFMDGHTLRYRLNLDGTYTLYSAGDNLLDDGGSSISAGGISDNQRPWDGKDWVWPLAKASEKYNRVVKADR